MTTTTEATTPQTVYVLTITSVTHYVSMSVYSTMEGAEQSLQEYVLTFWDEEEMGDEDIPEDAAQAVIRYFDLVDDEEYEIAAKIVHP